MPAPDLIEFLRTTDLFRPVSPEAMERIAGELTRIALSGGEMLVRQGDLDSNLYLVLEGTLRLTSASPSLNRRVLLEVQPGESVTEMSVLSSEPSPVSIEAAANTQVVALSRAAFDRFSATYPDDAAAMMQAMSARIQRYRLAVALHFSHLFDDLRPEILRDLESELEIFTLYGGEVLFRQGEPGDYLCVIVSGRVTVLLQPEPGRETAVTELGSGELVGEMAVVSDQIRTATVEATRDTQLAKLTKVAYQRFLVKHPEFAVQMVSRKLADRLRETTAGRTWQPRAVSTFVVLPIHPSAPKSDFSERLAKSLSRFGPTLRLTSQSVDTHLGRAGIAQTNDERGGDIRLVEWLNHQELEHTYLVYEADSAPSPWTERCIRQADHVILLADSEADPSPSEMETGLRHLLESRRAARPSLVLAHKKGDPSGTARWLDVRSVARHFHVRSEDDPTMERVARTITGRAMGLTLGGGFARGLAHLGAFRAFEEMGIAADAVGGTSMGAIVGAFWSMGWDRDTIQRKITGICTEMFGDLTFPFIAFKTGNKFSDGLRKLVGDQQIEDLWVPFFCVSANLNRSELRCHTRGSLAKAVLAASRAPGVFPPIVYDGELHVDGGVINNVPVDLMKEFSNSGITVGIDVSPPHELNQISDYGDNVSGWRAAWRRWDPFSRLYPYTPSILLVMIRTLEYSGIANKNIRLKSADIYMYPDMLKFKRTDFHRASEIEQAGFDCACKAVANWMEHSPTARARRPDVNLKATANVRP